MKRVFLFLLVFFTPIFAQKQNNDVSLLPAYIYGKGIKPQLQIAEKIASKDITLSTEQTFLDAVAINSFFSVDYITPYRDNLSRSKVIDYRNGVIEITGGNLLLPAGRIEFNSPSENSLLSIMANGYRKTDFVQNGDSHNASFTIGYNYFEPINSNFLPGSTIFVGLDGNRDVSKFYGSLNTDRIREINNANVAVELKNQSQENLNYGLRVDGGATVLSGDELKEYTSKTSAYLITDISSIHLYTTGDITLFQTKHGISSEAKLYSFLNASALAGFNIGRAMKLYGGANFTTINGESRVRISGLFSMRLADGLQLTADFNPKSSILTIGNLLQLNKYMSLDLPDYIYVTENNSIGAAVKFEYKNIFELNGNVRYTTADNSPYFADDKVIGVFECKQADITKKYASVEFLLHPIAGAGKIYSSITYCNTEDSKGNKIPYQPLITGSVSYGRDFDFYIANLELYYQSASKISLEKGDEGKSVITLNLKNEFIISDNFSIKLDLLNLLNSKEYILHNYTSPGVNAALGVMLKW